MTNQNNSVPFDPGYAKHISSFMYFNEQVKMALKSLKTPQQRAFKYKQFLPQVFSIMEKEIGFYYGCLLWATYINYETPAKEIADNSFFGKTEEELQEFDYLSEVNYILNFFNQYPKDLNYYKIQGPKIEPKHIKTVEIYKKFLIENKSFINTKTTAELKIPNEIKKLTQLDLEKIKDIITLTTTDGNFERLFEFCLF